jgi:hypothetical protein
MKKIGDAFVADNNSNGVAEAINRYIYWNITKILQKYYKNIKFLLK